MNSEPTDNTLARCPRRPVSAADASELRVTFGVQKGRTYAEVRYFDCRDGNWLAGKGLRVRAEEFVAFADAFAEAARRSGIAATRTEAT